VPKYPAGQLHVQNGDDRVPPFWHAPHVPQSVPLEPYVQLQYLPSALAVPPFRQVMAGAPPGITMSV
jgi:hypothetical protein